MKRVAILQSNYIPWKGYFDIINSVDEFIFYDEVQYTKNDWRNRNKLKSADGIKWITIPVKHSTNQSINEIDILHPSWTKKHFNTLVNYYSKAPFFKEYYSFFADLYNRAASIEKLSVINHLFITEICKLLNIDTKLSSSSDYILNEGKTERLVSLCKQAQADIYLSGPAAKDYLNEKLFTSDNITVEWMDYSGYPEYEQLYPPFEHGVSILDLLFSVGSDAPKYMKSFK